MENRPAGPTAPHRTGQNAEQSAAARANRTANVLAAPTHVLPKGDRRMQAAVATSQGPRA